MSHMHPHFLNVLKLSGLGFSSEMCTCALTVQCFSCFALSEQKPGELVKDPCRKLLFFLVFLVKNQHFIFYVQIIVTTL